MCSISPACSAPVRSRCHIEHSSSYRDRHPSVIYFHHCSRKTVAEPVGCTLPVFVDMANFTSSAPPGSGIVFFLLLLLLMHFSSDRLPSRHSMENLHQSMQRLLQRTANTCVLHNFSLGCGAHPTCAECSKSTRLWRHSNTSPCYS